MATTDQWDPSQYNKFAAEREQPFWDLAALLEPAETPRLVDLGCGDGRLTSALRTRTGAASAIGIDSSESMLRAAEPNAGDRVRFEMADIGSWERPGSFDVAFASASLHWVPDHPAVLARWTRSLDGPGQLAVQVPANADHPVQLVASELAGEWLEEPPPDPVGENVLRPEEYAAILEHLGYERQHVRLQVYPHRLASTDAVVEWVKGTTLTRFKGPLGAERWEEFVEAYRARLLGALGDSSPYFYPFKRILLWGRLG